jgi:hypothetical protein
MDGSSMEIKNLNPKGQPVVTKQELVDDMADLIQRMPLTDEQILKLYNAVSARLVSKHCALCGKLGLQIEGETRFLDGDMSKPKKFVCRRCKNV